MEAKYNIPTDPAELAKFKDGLMADAKKVLSQEWTIDGKNDDGSEKRIGTVEQDGLVFYGCKGTLPYTPKQMAGFYSDPKFMLGFVEDSTKFEPVRKIDDESAIEQCHMKTPFIMSNREMISFSLRRWEGETLYNVVRPASVPDFALNDDFERAFVFVSMTVEPHADGSLVSTGCICDLGGAVPDWLKNQINKLYLTEVNDLKTYIPKYLKEKN
mmetsp:Transcript_32084/g.36420  ORF Transcript_32084/g.36420 Transcript_32084/m.36420 type:complete len:214 (-) Transcript_32084:95-736(-)